jgi:D-alanine-D-alanine ligase
VEEITPARLSEDTTKRVQALTAAIYDILGASGIIRIDYIISKNEAGNDVINMLEINTTPGMTATSFIPQQVRADGKDMKDVLNDIIADKLPSDL